MSALDDAVKHIQYSADSEQDKKWGDEAAAELSALRARLREAEGESESRRLVLLDKADETRREWIRAENAEERERKMIGFLKRAINDEFCDNDGRGCGTGSHAQDLLDELAAALTEAK